MIFNYNKLTTMKSKYDCDDIYVVITHPWQRVKVSLDEWIRRGPGRRKLMSVVAVYCADGRELPRSTVPWRYRNTLLQRLLIYLDIIADAWADVPEGEGLS